MTLSNVTFLVFASSLSSVAMAGLNEAHIPMVPPPYQMVVLPKQTTADRQLTEKVQQQLKARIKNYNPEKNMIVSHKGEVILQGKVNSSEEEQQILEALKEIKGVTKVQNQMAVIAPSDK